MSKYLIILEDGALYTSDKLSKTLLQNFEDGIVSIVDFETVKELFSVQDNQMMWSDLPPFKFRESK